MGQRLTRRGRIWYAHVYIHEAGERRRVQKSTGCVDRAAAEKVASQWERDAANPDDAALRGATLSDAIRRLIKSREELVAAGRRSPETPVYYRKKLGHWVRLLEGGAPGVPYVPFKLAGLKQRHVDDFITTRRGEGVTDSTIGKEVRALYATLATAKRAGMWKGDPDELLPVDFMPEYIPKTRWLPPAEVHALLSHLLADRAAHVAFAVATGANRSETQKALRADVDLAAGRVLLRGTKTPDRWRTVVVALAWQKELLEYALKHGEGSDGALFRGWQRDHVELKEAAAKAGIAPLSSNDLRRSFSHWMRAAGVRLETLAPLMGHADTTMVQKVYGKMDADELAARMRMELGDQCITGASPGTASPGLDGPDGPKKAGKTRGKQAAVQAEIGFRIPR